MKEFQKPAILKLAKRIASRGLCDHCLGRQFARVSTGMTNEERGAILRKALRSGSPPANEMTSGLRVSFSSSRMTDFFMPLAFLENVASRSLIMAASLENGAKPQSLRFGRLVDSDQKERISTPGTPCQ